MKKKTRIVELVISDDSQELTIDAISLVSSPAIEQDFVFFGKEKNNLTFAKVDEEKRMLISPALIPNKQIFRYDPQTDSDYYVYFSKETVATAAALYLKHNNHHKATYEHQDRISGVLTVESWIKEGDQDKSNLYGFKGLPLGTWFVKMKIENSELWEKIKSGEVKGLSIEGYFIDRMETMSKAITDEQIRTAYKELQAEGKVKVELGVIENLKKLGDKFMKLVTEETKETKTIFNAETELKGIAKGMEDTLKKGSSEYAKLEKSAKELGINVKDIDAIQKGNTYRLLNSGGETVKKVKSNLSKLKSIQ